MDLDPPKIELPDGRTYMGRELQSRSPKQCFKKKDLYTTRFGHVLNDEIEQRLFGVIDTKGARAVRAFAGGDPELIHRNFLQFFEYLSAQKLRTPKGLDWIKSKYPTLTQNDLMTELQFLRRMYCTMWIESVCEVVSAKHSAVKFIATDHPVTVYNPACHPKSTACHYPEEPAIGLKGTQTLFALDANHSLILTNLEYALDPINVDLQAPRQNERYFGQTLSRTDTMIRTRKLTTNEVISMNILLKIRSRQYVAAYEEAWLFPERTRLIEWEEIGKILLPQKKMLGQFSGEIFVETKDGSIRYSDAYGRTDRGHAFLKKKKQQNDPAPNDLCGCGSGRKFRLCCFRVDVSERQPWDVYSIRERNLMFCNAVLDILGLNKSKSWLDVRRQLSNVQVVRIHELLDALWPQDSNIARLLPRSDHRVFKAVYMGVTDPCTICGSVIGSLAYFDEVFIRNPFSVSKSMRPDLNPILNPAQHKSQTLKNVSVLLTLRPFIDLGVVHLVPDIFGQNAYWQQSIMAEIKKRSENWKPTEEEVQQMMELITNEYERSKLRLPDHEQRREIGESLPGNKLEPT